MSETANHTVDITDQCVRQLIFYLHTTSLLDGIRPDDLAKTHETLKFLAKEAGIDLKDPDNGKVREHVKDATKLIMERTGLIEKQEDGTYRIPNEQLYKDTIYTISLRLDRERALRAMLDVSTKIQEKALKAALGIVRSDRDIAKSVSETLREHDGIMHLAEAVVQNAKESRLSRAADFLADENVRGFAEEIARYTKEATSQASAVHSTAKKVLEIAQKVSDETYLATTQVRIHPELYGDTTEETAKEVESVWNRNESAMARLIDGAKRLARLDHDIPLLSGFLDVHKELFPEMPKLCYEDISNEAKEKIGDRRNCWQISLVNGATSVFGSIVIITRGKLVKALEKYRPETSRREKEGQFLKRFYQNAVVNLLTKGDAWLRTRYEASLSGVYKMDDICMQVYDLRLKNLERERDPKENGMDFAKAFSESNLWRCGISENIPGWFCYMQTGPEDRAWTLASLKAGIRVSEEGIKWDSALAKAGAEKIYRAYMHGDPGYSRWKKDIARLEESLIHEHEAAKEQMEHLRAAHGRTRLSEYTSFNPDLANERERDEKEKYFKTDEAGYLAADMNEVQKDHKYLCIRNGRGVSLMEFPDPEEKEMDSQKRERIETTASVGILGKNGYCSAIRTAYDTDHTRNAEKSKRATLQSTKQATTGMLVSEVLQAYARTGERNAFRAENREICQKMVSLGYTASICLDGIRFTDPDGMRGHHFEIRLGRDNFPMEAAAYASRLKDGILDALVERHDLWEGIEAAMELEKYSLKAPLYQFAKRTGAIQSSRSDALLAAVRNVKGISTDEILDLRSRERKTEYADRLLGQFDPEAIRMEYKTCMGTIRGLKELARQDLELAWCKTVLPDCERTEDEIIGHAVDGTVVRMSSDGQIVAEQNTVASVKAMGQILEALQRMQGTFGPGHAFSERDISPEVEGIDASEYDR